MQWGDRSTSQLALNAGFISEFCTFICVPDSLLRLRVGTGSFIRLEPRSLCRSLQVRGFITNAPLPGRAFVLLNSPGVLQKRRFSARKWGKWWLWLGFSASEVGWFAHGRSSVGSSRGTDGVGCFVSKSPRTKLAQNHWGWCHLFLLWGTLISISDN